MYPAGRYNLNFDISAALLAAALFIIFLLKKDRSNARSRMYGVCCVLMFFSSASEVIALVMRNDPSRFIRPLAVAANLVAHLTQNLVPYALCVYIVFYIGADHYLNRGEGVLLSIPAVALTVMLLVPPLQRWMYYFAEDGTFHHGPLYNYVFIQDLFYLALGTLLIVAWQRSITEAQRAFFVILVVCGCAETYLAVHFPYLRATNFLETLMILIAFFALENNSEMKDDISGLANYSSFVKDSLSLFGPRNQSAVITIKVMAPDYYRMTFGHENSNALRREIGLWLNGLTSRNVKAYYIGNGIFTFLLYGEQKGAAEVLSRRIHERFQQSWKTAHLEVLVPAEVWLSYLPENVRSQEQLLLSVEMPANPSHKRGSVLIADEFRAEQRKIAVNRAITNAVRQHWFKVFYQPIYDTRVGRIRSAEALIRLTDPELGPISPEEFIKIAEQVGLINEIGLYVFREVCRFYTENHLDALGVDFIEVNLSTVQCMDEHLADKFRAILEEYHLDPCHIDLEITESAIIHNPEMMMKTVENLQQVGFTFSLDDFGTGFSNYEYIITFPLSLIKIDKSILWAADQKKENDLVLSHTIQMGKDLNRGIVVEGVETAAQRDKLISRGVEYLQGFLYSRAVEGPQFIQFVKDFNSADPAMPV